MSEAVLDYRVKFSEVFKMPTHRSLEKAPSLGFSGSLIEVCTCVQPSRYCGKQLSVVAKIDLTFRYC